MKMELNIYHAAGISKDRSVTLQVHAATISEVSR